MAADITLFCCDCSEPFIFSVNEQAFFREKNLKNSPKRCPNCRVLSKVKREGKIFDSTTEVNCAACNVLTIVPFKAKGHKPVYCATCFAGVKHPPVHHPPFSAT